MIEIALALILVTVLASPLLLIIFCGIYTVYLMWKENRRVKIVKALKELERQGCELTPEQSIYLYQNRDATRDEVLY